jgi:hypothetical protein
MLMRRNGRMRSGLSLLGLSIAAMCLTACAVTVSEPKVATPVPAAGVTSRPGCPQVAPIKPVDQDTIAAAIAALPAGSPLLIIADDDLKMRDEARACRGQATTGKTGK